MAGNPLLRKRKVSEKVCELPADDGNLVPYHVREMGGTELDRFEELLAEYRTRAGNDKSIQGLRALMVCFSACDPAGKRYFSEDDLPSLQDAPGHLLDPLFMAGARINGKLKEATDALEKNSADAPAGDSA